MIESVDVGVDSAKHYHMRLVVDKPTHDRFKYLFILKKESVRDWAEEGHCRGELSSFHEEGRCREYRNVKASTVCVCEHQTTCLSGFGVSHSIPRTYRHMFICRETEVVRFSDQSECCLVSVESNENTVDCWRARDVRFTTEGAGRAATCGGDGFTSGSCGIHQREDPIVKVG